MNFINNCDPLPEGICEGYVQKDCCGGVLWETFNTDPAYAQNPDWLYVRTPCPPPTTSTTSTTSTTTFVPGTTTTSTTLPPVQLCIRISQNIGLTLNMTNLEFGSGTPGNISSRQPYHSCGLPNCVTPVDASNFSFICNVRELNKTHGYIKFSAQNNNLNTGIIINGFYKPFGGTSILVYTSVNVPVNTSIEFDDIPATPFGATGQDELVLEITEGTAGPTTTTSTTSTTTSTTTPPPEFLSFRICNSMGVGFAGGITMDGAGVSPSTSTYTSGGGAQPPANQCIGLSPASASGPFTLQASLTRVGLWNQIPIKTAYLDIYLSNNNGSSYTFITQKIVPTGQKTFADVFVPFSGAGTNHIIQIRLVELAG